MYCLPLGIIHIDAFLIPVIGMNIAAMQSFGVGTLVPLKT
jgi:hypothetical protein